MPNSGRYANYQETTSREAELRRQIVEKDRQITELESRADHLYHEIDRLGMFVLGNFKDEPSVPEGVVDTVIRLMEDMIERDQVTLI